MKGPLGRIAGLPAHPTPLPVDDPKKLKDQKPDYVEDRSGTGDPDVKPSVGTDPMALPQEGKEKTIVSPDPEKVREHERRDGPDLDRALHG